MENNWQTKQGHNIKGEIQGYTRVPDELKYDQRVTILFSKWQLKIILSYCTKNNMNKGEFFRDAVYEYLEKRNENLSDGQIGEDPRQQKMF